MIGQQGAHSLIITQNHLVPKQIFYPFTMYIKTHSPLPWVRNVMHVTSIFILAVAILASIGSVYALATS